MSLSVLLFASILGTWVDRGTSRLATLISTITANRISVIAACICWFFIVGLQELGSQSTSTGPIDPTAKDQQVRPEIQPSSFTLGLKTSLFILVVFLSVIERLSRTANLFSIERDWVPAMVAPESLRKDLEPPLKFGLTELNAVMSRIDLICKLLSPIAMSAFLSAVGSVKIGIMAVLILNGLTWTAEIWSARIVWKSNDRLQESKRLDIDEQTLNGLDDDPIVSPGRFDKPITNAPGLWWKRSGQRAYEIFQTTTGGIATWVQDYGVNLRIYFGHAVWQPSMALSILHFSVLNYSPTLTVYLLNSGFSMNFLTAAKALSAVAELGSTFFTPWGVRQTGKLWAQSESSTSTSREEHGQLLPEQERENQEEGEGAFAPQADMGLALLGLWSLVQMVISLVSFPQSRSTFRLILIFPGPGLHCPLGRLIHSSLPIR